MEPEKKQDKPQLCDCCEEHEADRRISLTDMDGILFDQIAMCRSCLKLEILSIVRDDLKCFYFR